MPRWLKILIDVLIIVTVVYWLGYTIYKILDVLRMFLHAVSEKKIWWVAIVILLGCTITTLCILEFCTDVKPFTMLGNWIVSLYNDARDILAGFIDSK